MKLSFALLISISATQHVVDGFSLRMSATNLPPPYRPSAPLPSALSAAATLAAPIVVDTTRSPRFPGKERKLGLLTFDLDDSLYPIEPVLVRICAVYGTGASVLIVYLVYHSTNPYACKSFRLIPG